MKIILGIFGLFGLFTTLFMKDIVSLELFIIGLGIIFFILMVLFVIWAQTSIHKDELSIVKEETNSEEIPSDFEMMFKTMIKVKENNQLLKEIYLKVSKLEEQLENKKRSK